MALDKYIYGSEKDRHQCNVRKSIHDMVSEGLVTELDRKQAFDRIDKGENPVLVKESQPDTDGNTVKTFISYPE